MIQMNAMKELSTWLGRFRSEDGVAMISENRFFAHDESEYDSQYDNHDSDMAGIGIVNLLRKHVTDLSGPVLELGCGTGVASLGLCKSPYVQSFLITDSSTAFIEIVRRKLARNGVDATRVRYAILADTDLDRLPSNSMSAVVLRSVVHHFLDVPSWIAKVAHVLRPGGSVVFEEPCSSGYVYMGLIAQMIAENAGNGLTDTQRANALFLANTMKSYNRRDIDKSNWEDKHLFRPEEMSNWAEMAGLRSTFISNSTFENFATHPDGDAPKRDFFQFFRSYMQYCMSFGEVDSALIAEAGRSLCKYVEEACSGTREPHLMGLFILRKPS